MAISTANMVNALIFIGEWDEAAALATGTVEEGAEFEGSGAGLLHDRLVLIDALRGDFAAAHQHLDIAEEMLAPEDLQDVAIHAAAEAAMRLAEGDFSSILCRGARAAHIDGANVRLVVRSRPSAVARRS